MECLLSVCSVLRDVYGYNNRPTVLRIVKKFQENKGGGNGRLPNRSMHPRHPCLGLL